MTRSATGSDNSGFSLRTAGKRLFSDYSYMVSFILILVIALSVNPNFFTWRNITNIFVQSSVIGVIAMADDLVTAARPVLVGMTVPLLHGIAPSSRGSIVRACAPGQGRSERP